MLVNAPIFVRLTFLAGGQNGTPVNCSWYETTTNANGFMSILINKEAQAWEHVGSARDFEDISWEDGNYWMKVEYKTTSGQSWMELGTLELSSTFYAFVSRRSEVAETLEGFDADFSGAQNGYALVYNATTQKWEPREINLEGLEIPTNLSDFNNDVHFIITETDPTVPAWAKEATKPSYTYSELQNTPDLSIYLTSETDPTVSDWAKQPTKPTYQYSEIQNTPTNVSTFTNDANYISTETQTLANVVALGNSAGSQLKNVTDPTDAQDAATKAYIDAHVAQMNAQMQQMNNKFDSLENVINNLSETISEQATDINNLLVEAGKAFRDERDGNVYKTVTIGTQTWMAENLRYEGEIPVDTELVPYEMEDVNRPAYRYYPNGDSENVATYGYLYNWQAAMNGASASSANPSGVQGICPSGWHLPSVAEWNALSTTLGNTSGAQMAGRAGLWETGILTSSSVFGISGFNALPAGMYYNSGNFYDFAYKAVFMASDSVEHSYYVRYNSTRAQGFSLYNGAASVRCVRDNE